jgi:regulator of cell morphogenesis and NO signaling
VPLLLRYGIDFCCGGQQSIADACARANIDPDAFLAELEAVASYSDSPENNWAERPVAELLAHILAHYHEPERTTLQTLDELAAKVARVHGTREGLFGAKLATEVSALREDLLVHMSKEEQILFPWIESGRGQQARGPVSVMMRDHQDVAEALGRIRRLTDNFAPPVWACGTVRALFGLLEAFDRELREHIHLENNVLFPRALRGE